MTGTKIRESVQMASAVASIGVLLLVPWMFTIERRVTGIESNWFTQSDGLQLWQKIAELPLNSPLNKVNVIEQKVDRLTADIKGLRENIFDPLTLESRLKAIEGHIAEILEKVGRN